MTRNRHIVLLAAFVLSAGMLCAETVVQNIHNLYNNNNGPLKVTNSDKTGTTDFVTYTCSGGTARFSSSSASNYKVSIFLTGSGAKVETTPPIKGLDSLTIYYLPDANKTINVNTKEGDGEWTSQTVVPLMNGVKAIKMPHVGDYALQILRGADVYITQIDYTVKSSCNCLRVTIEE